MAAEMEAAFTIYANKSKSVKGHELCFILGDLGMLHLIGEITQTPSEIISGLF